MTTLNGNTVLMPPPLPRVTPMRGPRTVTIRTADDLPVTSVQPPPLRPIRREPARGDVIVVPVAGPPGAAGGAAGRYTHTQAEAAASWTVVHGLQSKPPVTLVTGDAPGEPVHTDVTYVDLNTLIVEWPSPVTGWAYL